MSETIDIRIAAPQRGQFIQLALMPLGTPELLVGDRAWMRRLRSHQDSQLHLIEAWGESNDLRRLPGKPHEAVLTLFDRSAVTDLTGVRLPGMEVVAERLRGMAVPKFAGDELHIERQHSQVLPTGELVEHLWIGKRVRVGARILMPWRAPWAAWSVEVERLEDSHDDLVGEINLGSTPVQLCADLIGGVTRWEGIVTMPVAAGEPQEIEIARHNGRYFEHVAVAATWAGDFMGWPVTASPWTVEQALALAPAMAPPANPNQAGVRGFYGANLAPLIWCSDGVCRENVDAILGLSRHWLERQATWFTRDGKELEPWPARPRLTFDNSKPWIDGRSDPYDDLGYDKPRGSAWTGDDELEHDLLHEHAEILALAARCSWAIGIDTAARAKLVALTYTRQWVGAFDGSWGPPFGRGAARTGLALLALAGLSQEAFTTARRVWRQWRDRTLAEIRSRRIPRALPAQVGSLQPGQIFTAYEEGLLALCALRAWRLFGDGEDLELAYLVGRHVATTIYWFDGRGVAAGYEIVFKGDGTPRLPSEGLVLLAGTHLRTWSVAGLTAFLAARLAMSARGIPGEAEDELWVEVATRGRHDLTARLSLESPAECLAQVMQTLWRADLAALAKPAKELEPLAVEALHSEDVEVLAPRGGT